MIIEEKILVTIVGKFDLGYIIKLGDGSTGELRVVEMKGQTHQNHLDGTEENLFGKEIPVYLLYKEPRLYVSELEPSERSYT